MPSYRIGSRLNELIQRERRDYAAFREAQHMARSKRHSYEKTRAELHVEQQRREARRNGK